MRRIEGHWAVNGVQMRTTLLMLCRLRAKTALAGAPKDDLVTFNVCWSSFIEELTSTSIKVAKEPSGKHAEDQKEAALQLVRP